MKMNEKKLIMFENKEIRHTWYNGEWFFSVVDVVGVLTGSVDAKDYWYKFKIRELEHGIELSTNCRQLKLKAPDGKSYKENIINDNNIFPGDITRSSDDLILLNVEERCYEI